MLERIYFFGDIISNVSFFFNGQVTSCDVFLLFLGTRCLTFPQVAQRLHSPPATSSRRLKMKLQIVSGSSYI